MCRIGLSIQTASQSHKKSPLAVSGCTNWAPHDCSRTFKIPSLEANSPRQTELNYVSMFHESAKSQVDCPGTETKHRHTVLCHSLLTTAHKDTPQAEVSRKEHLTGSTWLVSSQLFSLKCTSSKNIRGHLFFKKITFMHHQIF